MQSDIDHIAISPDLGHLDPVTDAQHVVAGELHAGDERQQGVLVDQQDDRGHRPQAGQQQQWRAVDQRGDDDDRAEDVQDHLRQLHVAFDRAGPGVLGACIDVEQGVEQGAEGQHHEQDGEAQGDIADDVLAVVAQDRDQAKAELHHQRRRHLRQAMEDFVMQKIVEPVQ